MQGYFARPATPCMPVRRAHGRAVAMDGAGMPAAALRRGSGKEWSTVGEEGRSAAGLTKGQVGAGGARGLAAVQGNGEVADW